MRLALPLALLSALPLAAAIDEVAAKEGRQIYSRSCTMCHGPEGAASDRGPALAGQRRFLRRTAEDLHDAIKNGIPGTLMPATGLSDMDTKKVVAYILMLRASAADAPPPGDVQAGTEVFWGKAGCGSCHMVNGRGGLLGPDLSNIGGERSLQAIREVLTTPRAAVPRGYRPVRLTTAQGQTIRGILRNEDSVSVQLLGEDQKLHLLLRGDLKDIVYETKSLMPSGYHQRLTPGEFQNLLAFVSRLAYGKEAR